MNEKDMYGVYLLVLNDCKMSKRGTYKYNVCRAQLRLLKQLLFTYYGIEV